MRSPTPVLLATLLCACSALPAQEVAPPQAAAEATPPSETEKRALLERVIANQKKNDAEQWCYEHIEKLELRKGPSNAPQPEVKVARAIPAGTGVDRIPVGADGKPIDVAAYRAELERLEHALLWASEDGRAQREAYEKVAKKQRERSELIDATRSGFIFTFMGRERRGERQLAKYSMAPNPAYKPTSRATSIFSKAKGMVWIDEDAAQLARVEVEVIDDLSIGGFLAKVYKGSRFMQERYEAGPGVWLPSYTQYDFDGRRLFVSFGIHERTTFSQYRRIGPPKEALQAIRAELGKSSSANAEPASPASILNTSTSSHQVAQH